MKGCGLNEPLPNANQRMEPVMNKESLFRVALPKMLYLVAFLLAAAPAQGVGQSAAVPGNPELAPAQPAAAAPQVKSTKSKQPSLWLTRPKGPIVVNGMVYAVAGWTARHSSAAPAVSDRALFSLHRGRVWFRGKPHERLSYLVQFSFDRAGADEYALLQGANLGLTRAPSLLDARAHYQLVAGGKSVLTAGFFRPAVGLESNAIVPALSSHEPGLTAVLARRGTVEAGHGRAAGVNLGGRIKLGSLGLVYQLGVAAPNANGSIVDDTGKTVATYGGSSGEQASPLIAGSLALTWGADAFRAAHMLHLSNTYSGKTSFTLGASGSHQGATDRAKTSAVTSAFAMAHIGGLNADFEWVQASRSANGAGAEAVTTAWHGRVGYSLRVLGGKALLEPAVLWTEMDGDDTLTKATSMKLFTGKGRVMDAALNLHLQGHKLRVAAHFIHTASEGLGSLPIRSGWTGLVGLQLMH